VSTAAAAEPAGRARAALGALVRAHLVEPAGAAGRWRMHDLLRLYARQVPEASPGEREEAFGRLLAWYLRQAQAADAHLRALAGSPAPAQFTGRDDALAWLDAERPGLVAAVTTAGAAGRHQEAMSLPLYLGVYLEWRRRFDDWLAVMAVSGRSARELGDKGSEAGALTSLGLALLEVRRFEEAVSAQQDAAAIFREAGDRHSEGQALHNLAGAYQEMQQSGWAGECWRNAAAAMRDAGDYEEAARLDQQAANAQAGQRS
jgi:tetratricopeptide (TPR) repeat protein